MSRRTVGIAMNGVTGRMGMNQHLIRSIVAIRETGRVAARGRHRHLARTGARRARCREARALARASTGSRAGRPISTRRSGDPECEIFFDADDDRGAAGAGSNGDRRPEARYCEKPLAPTLDEALRHRAARARARREERDRAARQAVPAGLLKLRRLVDSGFLRAHPVRPRRVRLLGVRWGRGAGAQRPSWNYRAEDGGGLILDMFCHWSYVLEYLIAPVRGVMALGATHVPERVDERGRVYKATADDAAYGIFQLDGGIIAQINSSWCVRVNRDELVEFQIDGTHGSAVVRAARVQIQPRELTRGRSGIRTSRTPRLRGGVERVPDEPFDNGFLVKWEQFLRHVVRDEPFPYDFVSGAKGVQLPRPA